MCLMCFDKCEHRVTTSHHNQDTEHFHQLTRSSFVSLPIQASLSPPPPPQVQVTTDLLSVTVDQISLFQSFIQVKLYRVYPSVSSFFPFSVFESSVLLCVFVVCSFLLLVIFCCMDRCTIYIFICSWTFEQFSVLIIRAPENICLCTSLCMSLYVFIWVNTQEQNFWVKKLTNQFQDSRANTWCCQSFSLGVTDDFEPPFGCLLGICLQYFFSL